MCIKKMIDVANKMSNGHFASIDENEVQEVSELTNSILSNIGDFIDNYGEELIEDPETYLHSNKEAARDAIEVFANILYELGDYING